MNIHEVASKVLIPGGINTGKLYLEKPVISPREYLPFTRAGGGSTTNQNGLFVEQVADLPAIIKRPGECARTALRPARTRVIARPEEFEDPAWSNSIQGTGIAPVKTDNFGTFMGRPTSRLQFEVGALDDNSRSYIQQTVGSNYSGTQSIWARSLTSDATITLFGAGSNDTVITTSWQKFELGVSSINAYRIGILDVGSTNPSLSADIEVAMCNWEGSGEYSTDFIPGNESSTQTRNADVSTETGLKAKGYIGATKGFIGGEFWGKQLIRENSSLLFSLGNSSEWIYFDRTAGNQFIRMGRFQTGVGGAIMHTTISEYNKWIFSWDIAGWFLSVNGSVVASGLEVFTFPTDNLSKSGIGGYWECGAMIYGVIKLPQSDANNYTTI